MDFLNKLYESNYFGIGLFAVISFLVVTFLVVLFFGKKDEKKRKLEEGNVVSATKKENLFKETSVPTPVEVPVAQSVPITPVPPVAPVTPVEPIEQVAQPVAPVTPVAPIAEPVSPVAPINYEMPEPEVVAPKIEEPATPAITENIEPIFVEPTITEPVEPIRLEPIKYDLPKEPEIMEPIKINIPEEPVKPVEPTIPIVEEKPVIVEPTITETYYKPIEKEEVPQEIEVPGVDFDALAKSISAELDELEKNSRSSRYEEVKVTPMSEVAPTRANQFSSVYVGETPKRTQSIDIDLPKRVDLPTKKNDEIEPESYNI